MYLGKSIALIIPARNEVYSLPAVLLSIPAEIDRVLVVDNGSTDATARVAQEGGAELASVPEAGYGRACLAGLNVLSSKPPDIIAFADGDGSDDLSRLLELIAPVASGSADLMLEKRIPIHAGALSLQQRLGNCLATTLIRIVWRRRFTDLGPMRALSWDGFKKLDMRDRTSGWTIEMQIKAVKAGLRIRECPLPYRARMAGRSKISGTVRGVARAGFMILWVILRETMSSCLPQGEKFSRKIRYE